MCLPNITGFAYIFIKDTRTGFANGVQIIYINLRYFFIAKGDLLTCNFLRSNVISKDNINQPSKFNEE